MSQHLAAILRAPGKPLELSLVATPTLEAYEVLIRTKAAAVNPIDWKQRDHGYYIDSFPTILGRDIGGVIEAVGVGVKNLKVGDRVAAFTATKRGVRHAAFQELTVQWADLVPKIPDSLSYEDASTIPATYVTSAIALGLDLGLSVPWAPSSKATNSTPIVILGGSSSTGQFALQLLRNAGYTNVVVTASPRNHELVKSLGASAAVDHSAADVVKQIEEAVGSPIRYIYNTIALQETQQLAADLISNGGRVVLTLPPLDAVKFPQGTDTIFTFASRYWDATSQSPGDGRSPSDFDFGKAATTYLSQALSNGSITPNKPHIIHDGSNFAKALDEGLDLNRKGLSGEKAVVVFP